MGNLELSTSYSFEALFKEHYSYLCATAYYMIEDESASRDIVQDFFLYCWSKRETMSITYTFKSYAVRSIRNASLNYLKKSKRVKHEDLQDIEKRFDFLFSDEIEVDESKNKALWGAISKLPEQRKKIFLLSNIDGLKYQEIANTLGISINTVKTQIRLAFQFLRIECKGLINSIIVFICIKILFFFTHF